MSSFGALIQRSVIAAVVAALIGLLAVTPAQAVTGCTGISARTCVDAQTGAKNYTNRTQWVGNVRGWGVHPVPTYAKQEIWGDGFYYSTSTVRSTNWSISRNVNRWVRSGTNICSATTYSSGYRVIACIRITV